MTADHVRTLLPCLRRVADRPADATPDRELLRRFGTAHDEAAFAEVVRRHGPMLLRVCRRVPHNGADAEDVCQAVFLLLARKAGDAGWHDSVAGWLFRTGYQLSLKARAAATRRARHEARARPARPSDPVAELTARELQTALDEELSRLPEKYRAPIVLCCLEGRSRDEAAKCLGWRLAAVKHRLERARERLRARLARRGVVLGTALLSATLPEGGARAAGRNLTPRAVARAASSIRSGQTTLAAHVPARVAALAERVSRTAFPVGMAALVVIGLALGMAVAVGGHGDPAPISQKEPARPELAKADPGSMQPAALPLDGHTGAVNAVAYSPDGRLVATAGRDNAVIVRDGATGRPTHTLMQPGEAVGLAFAPDGKTLAVTSAGKDGSLILWDSAEGTERWRSNPRMRGIYGAVAFSGDGNVLMAGFGNNSTWGFDAAAGRLKYACRGPALRGSAAVASSPDGKLLAVAVGGFVQSLDPTTGNMGRHWEGKADVTALAFLSGGSKLVAADGGKSLRVLDVATGKETVAFEAGDAILALAVSADGQWLTVADAGGAISLWDVAAGTLERRFAARGAVRAVALSPDGKRLATAGEDGAVVWDLGRDEKPPTGYVLTEAELTALWGDLADRDADKVYAAARLLRADPERSVPFLKRHLAAKLIDRQKLGQLFADLDAAEFKRREAATKDLRALGRSAEAAMREALAANPSPEAKARLERLLAPLEGQDRSLYPGRQRDVRAVRVLAQAGTPEAKQLLELLARDSPGWWVARRAANALGRTTPGGTKP
jgi:RNA polymerase sigma factor (sigma-70 family)